jgi:F5/8 type C domain
MSTRLAKMWYPLVAMVVAVGGVTALVATASPPGLAADAELPVAAVTASSHDGNVPQNAVDGNLGTRWSAEGDPEWIQFDLGQSYTVGSVRVAWYQGDQRQARFDVQTSVTGSSWSTVHSGLSSGTTTGLETVDFADSTGRYVRIVGHGNTDNAWNSITEVEVFGSAAPPGSSQDLPVSAVSASSHDGNVPANTRDGNFDTRWSAEGDPEWISFDLGATPSVHFVMIAWYQGDVRRAQFDVQTSTTGSSWSTVHSGLSSGITTGFETVNFADSTGRYVRIVGHGNTDNAWNSITEVKIFGAGGTPPPTTTAPPTTTTAPPPVGTDPNGVRQLYPSRTGKAAPWTLGFGDWQARLRPDGASIAGSGKDTVLTNSGQVRISVEAVDSSCEGEPDHGLALQRGYMCSPNDWYNVEFTGYIKLDTPAGDASDQDWTWYAGGGRHTGDGWEDGCMGSAYKGSYHYRDADVRYGKEQWHVNYDYKSWTSVTGGIDYTANRSRWLGMKYVKYQFTRNGQRGIRLELWLDLDGIDSAGNPRNNWQRVRVVEDHPDAGSWGGDAGECRAPDADQIMFWGGPWVTYRWDNTTSRLRLMSVREITPPTS